MSAVAVALPLFGAALSLAIVHRRAETRRDAAAALAVSANRLLSTEPQSALALAIQAVETAATPATETTLHAAVWKARPGRILRGAKGSDGLVLSVDGTHLAAIAGSTVQLWDVDNASQIGAITIPGVRISTAAFSPDAKQIATAGTDATLRIWDVASGRKLVSLEPQRRMLALGASAAPRTTLRWESPTTLIALTGRGAERWDIPTGKPVRRQPPPTPASTTQHDDPHSALSANQNRMATCVSHRSVAVWDIAPESELFHLPPVDSPESIALSSDGSRIATIPVSRQQAVVWDARTGRELVAIGGNEHNLTRLAFSQDGTRLVTRDNRGSATVWDAVTGQRIQGAPLKPEVARSGSKNHVVSPDGKLMANVSSDGTVKLSDASGKRERLRLPGRAGVNSVIFNPDSKRLIVGGLSGVDVYTLEIEELLRLARTRLIVEH